MTPTKTTPGNPQTVAGGSVTKNRSRFNDSYPVLSTLRFGEYTPHFFAETVPNDKDLSLRCSHALRSYTLKSPLLNNVKLHKDYFNVPLQAIIPKNYQKFKVNPVQGDDCPDDAGTSLAYAVKRFFDFVSNRAPSSFGSSSAEYEDFFRWLVALQWFFSEGSLLAASEIRIGNFLSIGVKYNGTITYFNADSFVDAIFTDIASNLNSFQATWGSEQFYVLPSVPPDNDRPHYISIREFFMRYLQQPNCAFTAVDDLSDLLTSFDFSTLTLTPAQGVTEPISIDLKRLFAYQIVCSHFYTNDHIDYIFSAELYRQNQLSWLRLSGYDAGMRFTMNGVQYEYDACSSHAVDLLLTDNQSSHNSFVFAFLSNIFNFNRSLRFMDYFVGGRSQPLAVGNTNVPVTGSNVSVIDITKGIQRQRFLNAVNRSGSRFEAYVKNLFGVKPEYDYHNPFYLGTTVDDVHTIETDNTGSAQFENASGIDFDTKKSSVTSNFKSVSQRFAFNFDSDRDSVLVGITWFDIPRFYPFGVNRMQLHVNRFDDFIPQAQFIGDQAIQQIELGAVQTPLAPFAYTGRYQEYKMRVPYCFGGVRHYLRSWSYLANVSSATPITPDFIRSISSELDKFYLSLSHYSLAGYFHFIILSNNEFSASRPMVKHPHIL